MATLIEVPLSITDTLRTRRKAWTAKELAEVLNLSVFALYKSVQRGSIPAVKIGTATRFDPAAIFDWWQRCAA